MDLENLLPLLLFAAAYLFKAFEKGGRKEQKGKARPAGQKAGPGRTEVPAGKGSPTAEARKAARPGKDFPGEGRLPAPWEGRASGEHPHAEPPRRESETFPRERPAPAPEPAYGERETFPRERPSPAREPASYESPYREPVAPRMAGEQVLPEGLPGEKIYVYEGINPELRSELPEEVRRIRESKRIRRTTPAEFQRGMEQEESGPDFDLRDAVIKAAILERPYY